MRQASSSREKLILLTIVSKTTDIPYSTIKTRLEKAQARIIRVNSRVYCEVNDLICELQFCRSVPNKYDQKAIDRLIERLL